MAEGSSASNPWTRFIGLLGRADLKPREGIHIAPCSSVHTCFMRFPIDVVYLSREAHVVKVVPALRPFRLSAGGKGAYSVLELPAGTIARTRTEVGDRVKLAGVQGETGRAI